MCSKGIKIDQIAISKLKNYKLNQMGSKDMFLYYTHYLVHMASNGATCNKKI